MVLLPAYTLSAETEKNTAYLLVVDKLSLEDIKSTTHLKRIVSEGAIGLASTRTLRGKNILDSSLTVGAGNIARAYSNGIMGFNHDEIIPYKNQSAADYYKNITGIDPGDNSIMVINIPEIIVRMNNEKVDTVPGAMGDIMRRNNLQVCVLGNGDNECNNSRAVTAIGMDSNGLIPLGDIGPQTYIRPDDSYLVKETNYQYLQEKLLYYKDKADLIIVDLSDLARLETAEETYPQREADKKAEIINNIDRFVNYTVQHMDKESDLLMVMGLSPAREQAVQRNYFIPVIAYGNGYDGGALTSSTTRRDYILANTDIAPTILNYFGLKDLDGTMIGRPIYATGQLAGKDTLGEADSLASKAARVNRLRSPVIKGFVILQIVVILLSLLAIFFLRKLKRFMEPLIVFLAATPVVMLICGKINWYNDILYVMSLVLITLFITYLLITVFKDNSFIPFIILAGITTLALDFDILTGASLIKTSILGYDPMAGARYYGIGNEYLGILIGSSILAAAALYEKYRNKKYIIPLSMWLMFQALIIGFPNLGANSGGFISAPVAFLVTIMLLADIRITPGIVFKLIGFAVVVITSIAVYDYCRPAELQSHIGRAVSQITEGGISEAFQIISRKLAMNIKLIKYTIWSRVFLIVLMVLILLFYQPVGAMKKLRQEYPYIMQGFMGILTAAVVVLAVNDSGIVAASTTSIYLAGPLLLLIFSLVNDEKTV